MLREMETEYSSLLAEQGIKDNFRNLIRGWGKDWRGVRLCVSKTDCEANEVFNLTSTYL